MGLSNFGKNEPINDDKPTVTEETEGNSYNDDEYIEVFTRYDKAHADQEYRNTLKRYLDLCSNINERYAVITTIGSFYDKSTQKLIDECVEAFKLDVKIKEKREYYELPKLTQARELKTLAMIYEKRGDFERAASVCVIAIESGFTKDGTPGGMRGRLARMVKKGNLELNEPLRKILEI